MWTIALFVLTVAEVKVGMVKAIEGGAGLKHQQRHMSTQSLASCGRLNRTMTRSNGEGRRGCSDISTSAHASSVSNTSGDVHEVAAVGTLIKSQHDEEDQQGWHQPR